ncbi:MAG: helix-turn-helix domain-containing protein [Solirubrobacteraceae bacterium]
MDFTDASQRPGGLAARVASEVRANLARRRISASRAAKELGWSQPYLSRRLNGRAPFDVIDLERLAELLDIEVIDFFAFPMLSSSPSGTRRVGVTNLTYSSPHRLTTSLTSRCVTTCIDTPIRLAA